MFQYGQPIGADAVKVINVCDVLDQKLPGWYMDRSVDHYDRQCAVVQAYCAENNAHFYSRDREDFSLYEARREAFEAGKKSVVVEDLS